MKNKLNIIIVLAILMFGVLSCSLPKKDSETANKSQETKTVVSTDGKFGLTIPTSWIEETDLNKDAVLQVSNRAQELYAIIIVDEKKTLPTNVDLDAFAALIEQNIKKTISDAVVTELTPTKVGEFNGRRFEVSGMFSGIKASYIFTIVETPKSYCQVMSWTLQSKIDENRSKLLQVSDSFSLVGNDAPATEKDAPAESNSKTGE